jgi:hypothetical protein
MSVINNLIEGLEWALSTIDIDDWQDDIYMQSACAKYVWCQAILRDARGSLMPKTPDCPHPGIQEPRTNLPKPAFDPYDTIEQQDFIQKGK